MSAKSLKAETGRVILSSQTARNIICCFESWMSAGAKSMTSGGVRARKVLAAMNDPNSL